MTDCIRKFSTNPSNEIHICFVLGCSGVVHLTNKTCPKCNFKLCDNGHCACSVSPETKDICLRFYDLCCDHKRSEEENYTLYILLECFYSHYMHLLLHEPNRTPALGWNKLTLLEKLTDSAKTCLHINSNKKALRQINKILAVLRMEIETKKKTQPLLKRCEFRETLQTRCNRTPVFLYNNHYFCAKHTPKKQNK